MRRRKASPCLCVITISSKSQSPRTDCSTAAEYGRFRGIPTSTAAASAASNPEGYADVSVRRSHQSSAPAEAGHCRTAEAGVAGTDSAGGTSRKVPDRSRLGTFGRPGCCCSASGSGCPSVRGERLRGCRRVRHRTGRNRADADQAGGARRAVRRGPTASGVTAVGAAPGARSCAQLVQPGTGDGLPVQLVGVFSAMVERLFTTTLPAPL